MQGGYIIYHPRRQHHVFNGTSIYCDSNSGNQDPYIWNRQFLHTYCHITQMKPQENHINFWVSGNTFPNFNVLFCDLVFVVEHKIYWKEANSISRNDPIVDSRESYNDHYCWAKYQHQFKKRQRYTLKANANRSFQPQHASGELIDLVPIMAELGVNLITLQKRLQAGFNSRPMCLSKEEATQLYAQLEHTASHRLHGFELESIRRQNPRLASPSPEPDTAKCL